MEFSEVKALITVDQGRRKGKAADVKPAVDEFLGDVRSIETVIVVRNTGSAEDRRLRRGALAGITSGARARPASPRG